MKKVLLGTSAIVLATASTGALAADPISLGISGGWTGGLLFGSQDDATGEPGAGTRSGNFVQLSEMAFSGSTTLDNGIGVSVTIELEGETDSSDQIDDSKIAFSFPGVGTLGLGGHGLPADRSVANQEVVPGGGVDGPDFLAASSVTSTDHMTGGGSETPGITFNTADFGGFTAGVGYQIDGSQGDRVTSLTSQTSSSTAAVDSIVSVGAGYSGEFSGVSLGLAAGYETKSYKDDTVLATQVEENNVYHVSASVGVAGFTVGAGYSVQEQEAGAVNGGSLAKNTDATDLDFEITNYIISAKYVMDALSFSLSYADREAVDNYTATTADDTEETTMYSLGAAYDLGAGVKVGAGVTFFDWEDRRNQTSSAATPIANENSGWSGLVTTSVSF